MEYFCELILVQDLEVDDAARSVSEIKSKSPKCTGRISSSDLRKVAENAIASSPDIEGWDLDVDGV
jgi:hypothetical protein